jgi:sporulation protein YlmC with PRC-barrel domain
MEISYNKLRQKSVVSVVDGKNLGKVCDLVFCYPQNTINGFYVTGGKGFRLTRQDVFIPICDVIKIGEDVVLTNFGKPPKDALEQKRVQNCDKPNCPPAGLGCQDRRSYEEYE